MAPPVAEPPPLPDGVKEGMKACSMKLKGYFRIYNPESYTAETLASNKKEWMAEVNTCYKEVLDYAVQVSTAPGVTDVQEAEIERLTDKIGDDFKNFLVQFNSKCSVEVAGQVAGYAPPPPAQVPSINNSHDSAASSNTERARKAEVEVEINIEKICHGVKGLNSEIRKCRNWSEAESHDIEIAMGKTADWKKQFKYLKERVWEVKRDVKCFDMDENVLAGQVAAVNTLEVEMNNSIAAIEHEDRSRGLYSLNKSTTANIKYPKFTGGLEEDFLKFKREFLNAVKVNRVRTEDQVSKLKECLEGAPEKMIPKTLKDLKTAWRMLSSYGDAARVMKAKKEQLENMEKCPTSKSRTAPNLRKIIEWCLNLELLIQEIHDLSELDEDLDREAYNPSTFNTLLDLFPLEVTDEMSDVDGNVVDKIGAVYNFVVEKREKAQKSLKHVPEHALGKKGSKDDDDKSKKKKKDKVLGTRESYAVFRPPRRFEECRICKLFDSDGKTQVNGVALYDAHTCNNASGCPVFVTMKTADRMKYAAKAKLCIYCLDNDFIYKGPHSKHLSCFAFKKNCFFTCSEVNCKKNYLVCVDHISSNEDKLERAKSYWEQKGKQFSTSTVIMVSQTVPTPMATVCPPPVAAATTGASASCLASGESPSNSAASAAMPEDQLLGPIEATDPAVSANLCNNETNFSEAVEQLKSVAGDNTIVHPIPEGEPVFMFSQFMGKTRPCNIFYDSGCSHVMVRQDVCDHELDAVLVKRGPIPVATAGDTTVYVNHEYAFLMEKSDGSKQVMHGVTADSLTAVFPTVSLVEAHKEIIKNAPRHMKPMVSKLNIPAEAGGQTDVLLGIMYQSCHPKILFTLPSGLFIAKLRLKSLGTFTGCIGGPHKSFSFLAQHCGDTSRLVSCFVTGLENFRRYGPPKIDGPIMTMEDYDLAMMFNKAEVAGITGVEPEQKSVIKYPNNVEKVNEVPLKYSIHCSTCGGEVEDDVKQLLEGVKDDVGEKRMRALAAAYNDDPREKLGDLKTLIKLQEMGIDIQYRCPRCRDCFKCKSANETEKISVREEIEDEAIKESVTLDYDNKKITAVMPLRGDPAHYLSDNRAIAERVLDAQCKRVQNDPEAKELVIKAFEKLFKNKYALKLSELTPEQQENILSKEPQHYLPWKCVFKASTSTPCRPAFDASMKTPIVNTDQGGRCLNDLCMKGRVSTLNLINMLLRFLIGSEAFCGDIRQFYNRISLQENQWHLQRVLYKEDLNMEGRLLDYVIVTLIYGVRCVSALSEAAVIELAKSVSNDNPRLETLLTVARFCDDIADSDIGEAAKKIIDDANALFSSVGLECKGWSVSGEPPHPDVSHDGVSVDVGGISWIPQIDSIAVKVPPLHFGRKLRGRLRVGTEIFDGEFGDLESFVPAKLTRRMVSSKLSSFFDPLGKFTPLISGMKADLRKVVKETVAWDDPVSLETRALWIKNLWRLHQIRGIKFNRAIIPSDAVDNKLELIAAVDAADLKVAAVYGRFRRKCGLYSCQLIMGRSILARTDSTIPKEELESLVIGSNLLAVVRQALDGWVSDYIVLSDSIISISWVCNEEKRMSIFHRNRVNQIRFHTDVSKIHFVRSQFNPADIPTRPDRVQDDDVGPDSVWENGLPWMKESLEKAIDEDIIKPSSELTLEKKEDIEESDKGYIIENDLEVLVKGHSAFAEYDRVEDMKYRAMHSKYIFCPKFSFHKVIKITALVFKFIAKLKYKRFKSIEEKAKLLPEKVVSEFVGLGLVAGVDSSTVTLTEVEVHRALLYWYQKASGEVWAFNKKETIKRVGVEKEGILFCRSRIMDGQRFLAAGEFDAGDLGLDIGLNLLTPLVDRHSPIALSIAIWIHQKSNHAGFESCYRTSLQYCHILQGPSLFKELNDECAKCRMTRKRFLDCVMGPVADHQLAICPAFHTAFLDLDGPYTVFVPGFEKNTRNRKSLATKNYIMTFCCPVTKALNLQVIETKEAEGVIEGLTRLGCEQGMPRFLVLDKESSFMKVVKEAEIDLKDVGLRCYKEFGIQFKTAPVAAHHFNGLVERKIRSVQESFKKIELHSMRLHSTGLQTFAKLVQNELNNLPLGFSLGKDATNTPLLKILTPNMMLMGRLNSRSLAGPLKLPKGPKTMMEKVEKLFDSFYRIWNIVMVPRLIPQPKWFKESAQEIKVDDVVYFQKVDNQISSEWTIGQVDSVKRSKDGVIRRVDIRYKNASEVDKKGRGPARTTERAVRHLVKLFNVEENYFVHDMEMVEDLLKSLEKDNKIDEVPELRVTIDNDGVNKITDKGLIPPDSCNCCCVGHCAFQKSWDTFHGTGKVAGVRCTGVTLAKLASAPACLEFPYVKEIYTEEDYSIQPYLAMEAEDELYNAITAMETNFMYEIE